MGRILVMLAALCAASPAWAAGDVAAFCRFHPDLDHPAEAYFGRDYREGALPGQVEATGASDWRCMDGAVLLCSNSADGTTCARPDPSRVPSRVMRDVCRDGPGQDFIPTYAAGQSSSVWRCHGREPVIIHTVRLDRRGYMVGAWVRLVVRNGVTIAPRGAPRGDALGEDPRWAWWPKETR